MYELYGLGADDDNDPIKKLKEAAWMIGIVGVGFITFAALIGSEVYGARERRQRETRR